MISLKKLLLVAGIFAVYMNNLLPEKTSPQKPPDHIDLVFLFDHLDTDNMEMQSALMLRVAQMDSMLAKAIDEGITVVANKHIVRNLITALREPTKEELLKFLPRVPEDFDYESWNDEYKEAFEINAKTGKRFVDVQNEDPMSKGCADIVKLMRDKNLIEKLKNDYIIYLYLIFRTHLVVDYKKHHFA